MNNYKITLTYDGTRYYGWQYLPNKDTIQGKLQDILSRLASDESGKYIEIPVNGAGRTDAGVHAKGMVASFELDTKLTETDLMAYINHYLPDDIAITSLKIAAPKFHARYSAVGKTYMYTCYCGVSKPVFDRKYVYTLSKLPDIEKMKQSATYLLGEHDFKNYCGNPKMKKSTIRNVDTINISEKNGYITFTLHGDGFLQNMVRIIVGTLLEVGYGNIPAEDIPKTLDTEKRVKAGPTAPPHGLCLISVDYN